MATALVSKISSLRTAVEGKAKSINLLQNLIDEQRTRHHRETEELKHDQNAALQKVTDENSRSLEALISISESWTDKNNVLETRIKSLMDDIAAAEKDTQERTQAIRDGIAESKQRAFVSHKQQQRERERAWYEQRKAEVEKLTWKGMSSTISRILSKHDEELHNIRYNMELSKEKLEVQFDNDLEERMHSLGLGEEVTDDISKKQKELARDALSRECNDHTARVLKIKQTFMEEKEMLKMSQTRAMEAALAKVKSTTESKLQLLQDSKLTKLESIRNMKQTSLGNIDKELATTQQAWEKEYTTLTNKRIDERNEHNRMMLMQRREKDIKDIIRAGFRRER
jgi:hypothetical protein